MYRLMLILLSFFILPSIASAHPGNTDSDDGHRCYTNCESYGLEYGEYHTHPGIHSPIRVGPSKNNNIPLPTTYHNDEPSILDTLGPFIVAIGGIFLGVLLIYGVIANKKEETRNKKIVNDIKQQRAKLTQRLKPIVESPIKYVEVWRYKHSLNRRQKRKYKLRRNFMSFLTVYSYKYHGKSENIKVTMFHENDEKIGAPQFELKDYETSPSHHT